MAGTDVPGDEGGEGDIDRHDWDGTERSGSLAWFGILGQAIEGSATVF